MEMFLSRSARAAAAFLAVVVCVSSAYSQDVSVATPTLVQRVTGSMEVNAPVDAVMHVRLPNNTLAGNALVLFVESDTSATADPTAVDNIGNIWAVAISVVGVQRIGALVATNATAGVNSITVTWNAAVGFVRYEFSEWYNVSQAALATALDGTGTATAVATSPVATSGFTTTVSGDLILQYGAGDGNADNTVTAFTKGTNFTPIGVHLSGATGGGGGSASNNFVQYTVQAAAGAITPTYTYTGTSSPADTIAFALKSDAAGTAPPATGIRIVGETHVAVPESTSSLAVQFPHLGNLIHASILHNHVVSTITDSDSNSWSGENIDVPPASAFVISSWRAAHTAPNTDDLKITVTWSEALAVGAVGFIVLYDIINADAAPFVQTVSAQGTQSVTANLDTVTITPVNTDGLIIAHGVVDARTCNDLVAPTIANGGFSDMGWVPSGNGTNGTMEDDDPHGHWYNGSSLSAQTFTWAILDNVTPAGVGGWGVFATEYKAAGAAVD